MHVTLTKLIYFLSLLASLSIAANAVAGSHGDHSHESGDHHAESKSFKVTNLKEGFYLLQGKGGNILVSQGDQGLLVIDADYADMSSALEQALGELGGELRYVINTHWHGDHTQGNQALGKTADIVAHDNVYNRLNSRQEVKLFNMVSKPYPAHALPDLTYSATMDMYFNDDKLELVHAPNGHTDGDTVVFFTKSNIVHMGDHFFNGFYPFIDVGSKGSVRQTAANIKALLPKIDEDTVIVPGHGPVATRKDLLAFHAMLLGTLEEVEASVSSGKTLEQIQSDGLSDTWDEWNDGFLDEPTWIGIVHSSLEAEAKK